ncbi:YceI family protein [Neptunomonas qingdaonensis]|uniref:Polyisoprenoid-binding protein YceI n=1 Tax=Neptunomonas qingdaonensis TaxID=1045558 RepID=A0A1I2TM61_9GAMM|nr:YceI family protein [Neptunomonas qingdaonensis]SFG65990.1 Polyisoprenoid-binding protein YceI [Neptunomonas qingdaonensis]
MNTFLKTSVALGSLVLASSPLYAADYVIDTKNAHASIEFRISHLGIGLVTGRFNTFEGQFSYDPEQPNDSSVTVDIDTSSIDSNHAERDKHIRSGDFLDVKTFPTAKFVSTQYSDNGDGSASLTGDLTLHGVTKPVVLDVSKLGEGNDPWGGFRTGFEGSTEIKLKDFGIDYNLGPASETLYLNLSIEGVKQ